MKLYPMKLTPAVKEILWGGDRLKKDFNKKADFDKLAESWELTVRPDGMNVIENGEYAGMTLGEFIDKATYAVIGDGYEGDRFPVLIKFIDARDSLSIQVHPSDDYALKNENEFGKTEVWYIVDCDEDSELVFGLNEGYSKEAFDKACENNTVESLLGHVKVKKGDVFFIPSGMVHAIGAGNLICEIQQNSNVTYRVYDYGRLGADGKPREIHVEKAKDVIVNYTEEEINAIRYSKADVITPDIIAACDKFKANHHAFTELALEAGKDSFMSLTFIEGSGVIAFDGCEYAFTKGDTYYIPAGMGKFMLKSSGAEVITAGI